MKAILSLTVCLLLVSLSAMAQKPYFQQEVNYRISVSLNDQQHLLNGITEFEYINHSPDTLRFLYIHLWPNAYSSPKTAWAKQMADMGRLDFLDAPASDRGFMDSLAFTEAGKPLQLEPDPQNPDIARVLLAEPLAPGAKTTLSTPFRVKIPADFSRMGHVGQGYQITQWFPKPAVYDNTGWHQMPYLDQGEFYSEFGSFDVQITVPKNYRVAATGVLQNADEQRWLDSLAVLGQNQQWAENDSFPPSDPQTKTLRYVQDKIHDFGWFADKRYHVMKSKVALPGSGREVTTWTFFLNKNVDRWKKAVAYVDSAVFYYSLWSGAYPYSAATAVEGALKAGGGMEYPMITVISDNGSDFSLDNVITHEVGHNWFYGILATNERDFVWMDESVNTFFQDRIMMKKYPQATLGEGLGIPNNFLTLLDARDLPYSRMNELAGVLVERSNQQQPIETHSAEFTPLNYGALAYLKGAYLFRYLLFYLGETRFDAAMHAYFDQCAFTHPGPADMKRVFEQSTGEDLSWFFHDLLQTRNIADYALTAIHADETGTWKLRVANRGDLTIPFSISAVQDGQALQTVWYPGIAKATTVDFPAINCDEFVLDHLRVAPEHSRDNNQVRTQGALRKVEALQLRLATGLENERKNKLYLLPALGWNGYNGLMAGALLHNLSLPARRFNFYALPMYAFGTQNLTGAAGVKYDIQPSRGVQRIRFEVNAVLFGNWQKVAPSVSVNLMPKDLRKGISNTLYADAHFIDQSVTGIGFTSRAFRAGYIRAKKGKLHSYTLRAYILQNTIVSSDTTSSSLKYNIAEIELTDKIRLGKKIYLRTRADLLIRENYPLSTGYDLLMENYTAAGRNSDFDPSWTGRQRFTTLGGTYAQPANSFGYNASGAAVGSNGLLIVQAEVDIPKVPFLDIWVEAVGISYTKTLSPPDNAVSVHGAAGLSLALGQTLQVHFPLAGMAYANGVPNSMNEFGDAVRFTLNLNPFNRPFDLPDAFLR